MSELLTAAEAAAMIQGNEYAQEIPRDLRARLKESGLVAVYGASDDLVEFEGAIHDEFGYGEKIQFFPGGKQPRNRCDDDCCPYFEDILANMPYFIEAHWDEDPVYCWTYTTNIPDVAWFEIYEDDKPYTRGFVFSLASMV